jgi:hypothetical protein
MEKLLEFKAGKPRLGHIPVSTSLHVHSRAGLALDFVADKRVLAFGGAPGMLPPQVMVTCVPFIPLTIWLSYAKTRSG